MSDVLMRDLRLGGIKNGLEDGSITQADVLNLLHEHGGATAALVEAAREEYATDDVEIDDSALMSEGEEGIWVSAWVWVPTT